MRSLPSLPLLLATLIYLASANPLNTTTTISAPTLSLALGPTQTFPPSTPPIPTKAPNPFCNQQGIPNQILNYQLESIRTSSVFACQTACTAYGTGVECLGFMFARNDALDAQGTDWQNCNLYSTTIGVGGEGLWWNSPGSGEWFSDRAFGTAAWCYEPGDTVGNVQDF
ncbi:hypothetical protein L207DRAFT_639597 [Hyaloscypha variabilis F]|uniref:Apple domain-containing protein n=1 Tax=Hyaloscypha variabilis (strain UAMH 11265 / GT02V1 / F) TaxID=1149755 RepID=A0A2J6R4R6_HYAVF|nr:hypothetical protein L207DRAFT_639597 [Hyaloscypha variabilis F]